MGLEAQAFARDRGSPASMLFFYNFMMYNSRAGRVLNEFE